MGRSKTDQSEKIRRYDDQNLACAQIILHNQERYGGTGSLMVEWAKQVTARIEREQTRKQQYARQNAMSVL